MIHIERVGDFALTCGDQTVRLESVVDVRVVPGWAQGQSGYFVACVWCWQGCSDDRIVSGLFDTEQEAQQWRTAFLHVIEEAARERRAA